MDILAEFRRITKLVLARAQDISRGISYVRLTGAQFPTTSLACTTLSRKMNMNLPKTMEALFSLWTLRVGLILLFLFGSSISGQKRVQDPFAAVPIPTRAGLIARLNLIVKYQREERWEKQFDLLTELYLQGVNKDTYAMNKKHYRAEGLEYRLLSFVPSSSSGPQDVR